jgi:hypothetical protein
MFIGNELFFAFKARIHFSWKNVLIPVKPVHFSWKNGFYRPILPRQQVSPGKIWDLQRETKFRSLSF